jgi:GntR family transcriptional regulator
MQFQIQTASKLPIYQQLAEQIREAVAQGRLSAGEQLPSVRDLSRTLVVNPNTIARAYTELERDGVLHTRQGKGVFVAVPSSDLTKSARKKKLVESLDKLLTEAVYLGFGKDELLDTVAQRVEKFHWQVGSAAGGN